MFQWLLVGIWHVCYDVDEIPWYLRLFFPALGGLLAGLVISRLSPESSGGGTGHVIDAIHHRGGRVSPRSGPYKVLVSALTIGTGGSAGTEGPIMHIGASVSTFFGGRLKLRKGDMRVPGHCWRLRWYVGGVQGAVGSCHLCHGGTVQERPGTGGGQSLR